MKTDNLIAFSVPAFILSGMGMTDTEVNGTKVLLRAAKVISHDGKELKLNVSGSQIVIPLESETQYSAGLTLLFDDQGAVYGYKDEGVAVVKPQVVETREAASTSRRSGSLDYRKDDVRQ